MDTYPEHIATRDRVESQTQTNRVCICYHLSSNIFSWIEYYTDSYELDEDEDDDDPDVRVNAGPHPNTTFDPDLNRSSFLLASTSSCTNAAAATAFVDTATGATSENPINVPFFACRISSSFSIALRKSSPVTDFCLLISNTSDSMDCRRLLGANEEASEGLPVGRAGMTGSSK